MGDGEGGQGGGRGSGDGGGGAAGDAMGGREQPLECPQPQQHSDLLLHVLHVYRLHPAYAIWRETWCAKVEGEWAWMAQDGAGYRKVWQS
jgi:hypothetical protein